MKINKTIIIYSSLLILSTLFILNFQNYSKDYENYETLCLFQANNYFLDAISYQDPLFSTLCNINSKIFGLEYTTLITTSIITGLSFYFKAKFFLKYKEIFSFAILFYICKFYLIQDATQIRAALAIAISGYLFVLEKPIFSKKFIILSLLGICSHLSFLAILPIIIFTKSKIKCKCKCKFNHILFIALIFLILITSIDILFFIKNLPLIDERVKFYLQESEENNKPIILNSYFIFRLIIIVLLMYLFKKRSIQTDNIIFLCLCGCLYQVIFNYNQVISIRLSELFSIYDSILVGIFFNKFKNNEKYITTTIFISICFYFMYRQIDVALINN